MLEKRPKERKEKLNSEDISIILREYRRIGRPGAKNEFVKTLSHEFLKVSLEIINEKLEEFNRRLSDSIIDKPLFEDIIELVEIYMRKIKPFLWNVPRQDYEDVLSIAINGPEIDKVEPEMDESISFGLWPRILKGEVKYVTRSYLEELWEKAVAWYYRQEIKRLPIITIGTRNRLKKAYERECRKKGIEPSEKGLERYIIEYRRSLTQSLDRTIDEDTKRTGHDVTPDKEEEDDHLG